MIKKPNDVFGIKHSPKKRSRLRQKKATDEGAPAKQEGLHQSIANVADDVLNLSSITTTLRVLSGAGYVPSATPA